MARDTTFKIYKNVNLSPATGNTFYFANKAARESYFATKLSYTVTACSYQRENRNYFRVNLAYKNVYNADYCSFINESYENKLFYCFINAVNYISDTVTEIEYTVDPIQTWLLDCNFRPCFIERMHTATDTPGDNLVAESLDMGEYIINSMVDGITTQSGRDMDLLVIFQSKVDLMTWASSNWTTKQGPAIRTRDGLIDSLGVYAMYVRSEGVQNTDGGSALGIILEYLYRGDKAGVTMDDIENIYIYPRLCLDIGNPSTGGIVVPDTSSQTTLFNKMFEVGGVANVGGYKGAFCQLPNRPTALNGYTPKNNKLFTYPFTLLHISNNNGSAIDLHYERFADPSQPAATVFGTTTAEAKVRIVPRQYYGSGNYDQIDTAYGLDSAPFPTVSLLGDSYNIWLAQNRNTVENNYHKAFRNYQFGIANTAMSATSSLLGGAAAAQSPKANAMSIGAGAIGTGVATLGSYASQSYGLYQGIKDMHAQQQDLKVAPDTAAGIQSEGLGFQNGKAPFTFITKTIDAYHAKMIDDFFTMYGYPIKQIGNISMHNRSQFTFIKTLGCIVTGNVPETIKNTIEQAFDAGLRFWAVPANIGDYSVTNSLLN